MTARVAALRQATLLLFLIALTLSSTVSVAIWMPRPRVHDEFSYLLAADTFAHGRVTNQPHPAWHSFETFHVVQQPTYMSKFPPAQGFFLAIGQLLFGLPLFGAWLTFALACAATHWMLEAFLPRPWAFLGAVVVMMHPVVFGWSQSFWGGSVSLLGGALLTGAFRRLIDSGRLRYTIALGGGVFLLANSRPFEGLALTVLVGGSLLVLFRKRHPSRLPALIAALSVPAIATLAFLAFYNRAITGDPLLLPHILYQRQYGIAPYFIGGHVTAVPSYRYEVMRQFHTHNELGAFVAQQSLRGVLRAMVAKLDIVRHAAFDVPLTLVPLFGFKEVALLWVPLLALPFALRRNRWTLWATKVLLVFMSILFLAFWTQPHYWAPAIPLLALIWIQSLRQMRAAGRRSNIRGGVAAFLIVLLPIAFVVNVHALSYGYPAEWAAALTRERIADSLRAFPGDDLVIVRYSRSHDPNFEWVYNEADIDRSPIVWARDGSAADNGQLLNYFSKRRIWLLEADTKPPQLRRFR